MYTYTHIHITSHAQDDRHFSIFLLYVLRIESPVKTTLLCSFKDKQNIKSQTRQDSHVTNTRHIYICICLYVSYIPAGSLALPAGPFATFFFLPTWDGGGGSYFFFSFDLSLSLGFWLGKPCLSPIVVRVHTSWTTQRLTSLMK